MHAHVRSALILASLTLALTGTSARAAGDAPVAGSPAPATSKFTVLVLGSVKNPGNVVLDSGARLSDALTAAGAYAIERLIARAGGTPIVDMACTPGGEQLRYVYLIHTNDTLPNTGYAIDFGVVLKHDPRYDVLLRANDRIYVPDCRASPRFILPPTFPRQLAGS